MFYDVAHYTCEGGCEGNEDSLLCKEGLWAVADGLGGHLNGEKASAAAVAYLRENAHGNYTDETISKLLEGANAAVRDQGETGHSTIAAVFAENDVLHMANVGDSRVYIFRKGRIIAQTKDHSVCQASVDMGVITAEDIRGSEDRSSLLKVLGNDEDLNLKKFYPPIDLIEGDAFLICSDGFWEYVHELEMEADLLKSDSAEEWLSHMLKRHLLKARNKGDNYSAICGIIKAQEVNYSVTIAPASTPRSMGMPMKYKAAIICLSCALAVCVVFLFIIRGSEPSVTDPKDITDTSVSISEGLTDETSGEIPAETEVTSVCETVPTETDETEEITGETEENTDETDDETEKFTLHTFGVYVSETTVPVTTKAKTESVTEAPSEDSSATDSKSSETGSVSEVTTTTVTTTVTTTAPAKKDPESTADSTTPTVVAEPIDPSNPIGSASTEETEETESDTTDQTP